MASRRLLTQAFRALVQPRPAFAIPPSTPHFSTTPHRKEDPSTAPASTTAPATTAPATTAPATTAPATTAPATTAPATTAPIAPASPTAPPPPPPPSTPPPPPDHLDPNERRVYAILVQALQPSNLEVQDISGGCGTMYALDIVSDRFRGLPVIKQHRLVNSLLADHIKTWHGVQMKTRAP